MSLNIYPLVSVSLRKIFHLPSRPSGVISDIGPLGCIPNDRDSAACSSLMVTSRRLSSSTETDRLDMAGERELQLEIGCEVRGVLSTSPMILKSGHECIAIRK
jgi:hypothetical protein